MSYHVNVGPDLRIDKCSEQTGNDKFGDRPDDEGHAAWRQGQDEFPHHCKGTVD